ncbi:MAG: hypothetical protein ACYSU7_03850 [Planctomycetota bacterium]|jgi:hypothetical protein
MRCRECDYPLWNLTARECPECGTAFKPSDYEFAPGTVQFCCPHCRQAYYGEAPLGHLEPRAFTCVKCDAEIDMDQAVVLPTQGVSEAATRPGVAPWIERRQRGTVRAFFATIGLAMIRPGTLMRGVPHNAPVGEAVAFGLLAVTMAVAVGGAVPYIGYWAWQSVAWGGWGASFWQAIWIGFMSVVSAFMVAGLLPVQALVTHAVLRLIARPAHSLDRTCQAVAYGAGAGAISAIPCAGPFVGLVWWLVSSVIMVRAGQQVSGGRASTAVLALPAAVVLFIGALAAITAWGISSTMAGAGFGGGVGWTVQSQQTYALNNGLTQYSWQNNNTGPEHALELVLVGNLGAWQWGGTAVSPFCQPGTSTTVKDIPVNDATLEDFLAMTTSEKLGAAKTLLDSLPDGIVAHRVGDFVFTYHGAMLNAGDPQLWFVVMVPDPDANAAPSPQDPVFIGIGNYMVNEITYGELAKALKDQNAYRQTLGLAPLPDLATVTHDKPALQPAASGAENSQDSQ